MSASALVKRFSLLLGSTLLLTACGSQVIRKAERDPKLGVYPSQRVVEDGKPIPKGGGVYRVGKAYTVAGRRYVPFEKSDGHTEVGIASWYGRQFHGRMTANGEVFDMHGISAAHRTMPMPSYARVTNLSNGRSLIVRVNDRGPYHHSRVIDVSGRAAQLLDMTRAGTGRVKVDYVGRAPLEGSDDRMLEASLRMDGAPAALPGSSAIMVAAAPKPFISAPRPASALVENLEESPEVAPAPLPTPVVPAAAIASAPMPKPRPSVAPAAVAMAAGEPVLPSQTLGYQPAPQLRGVPIPQPKPVPDALKGSAQATLGSVY